MASIRSHFWRTVLKISANYNKPLDQLRAKLVKDTRFLKPPKDVKVTSINAAGISAEWLDPPHSLLGKTMIYLHGGGYVMGSPTTHRSLVARLAKACGVRTLSVDYRLAPEHPFPAALEDALTAYQWMLDQGVLPKNIIIAGDSAGGGLSLATLISLRDNHLPLPAMALCISPWTDLTLTGESITNCAKIDPYISQDLLKLGAHYVGDNDPQHPLISPFYADLKGLPPLLIHAGTDEVLLSDTMRLAETAKHANVEVTVKIWERMWHDFHLWAPYLPEANQAIKEISVFVEKHWNNSS
ncbi:MAG: alpha/beta hydrolase [Porticoccus sp.]|nr:alpha/beta hydrolase [Porticoccus sp.]